jgi:hypothetical protein
MVATLLVWVNQVGLPGFLKAPLVEQLQDRGIGLEFGRLRVRLTRGLVAETVNLWRVGAPAGEHFHAEEVRIRLGWEALLELRPPEISALSLRDAQVIVTLPAEGDRPAVPFHVGGMQVQLRFITPDVWEIERMEAVHDRFLLTAVGTVTNALALQVRRREGVKSGEEVWRSQLSRVSRWLDATSFESVPAVEVGFALDLKDPSRSTGALRLRTSGLSNVWMELDQLRLDLRLDPERETGSRMRGAVSLEATGLDSRWGEVGSMRGDMQVGWDFGERLPENAVWAFDLRSLKAEPGTLGSVQLRGTTRRRDLEEGLGAPWNLPPVEGKWAEERAGEPGFDTELRMELEGLQAMVSTQRIEAVRIRTDLEARHGIPGWRRLQVSLGLEGLDAGLVQMTNLMVSAELVPRMDAPVTDAAWGFWRRAVWVLGHGKVEFGPGQLPRLAVDGARWEWDWRAPVLKLDRFRAAFGGGELTGNAELDVETRQARATASSTADPHAVMPWMLPNTRKLIGEYGWQPERLPKLWGEVGIRLHGWGLPGPEERQRLQGSVTVDAQMDVTNATFRGLPADRGTGRITYTNRFWRIGPLHIRRPEGDLLLTYDNNDLTKEYRFGIRSEVDPKIVRPLLEEKAQLELDRIELPVPPRVEGEVWGRWQAPEETGFRVDVAVTNLTVRGQPVEWATGEVSYTNRVMTFRDVTALAGGAAHVDGATYDIGAGLLSFTNARANVPVMSVARVIGPKTMGLVEPYQFPVPPRAVVNGVVSVRGPLGTDIRIDLETEDFRWWRLRATNAMAQVHFKDETLSISGLRSGFNGGDLAGDLWFDWSGGDGDTDYRLKLAITNVSFPGVVSDLWQKTNNLEGTLTGRGEVTSASIRDTATIVGSGELAMTDGFLWGLPIFGMFSPLFDSIVPGMGQSRFTSGSATFRMTNGLIDTRDFEMKAATMRLQYRGTVDWEGQMDATMEAELLRDVPLVGRLLQFAFTPVTKLLEYRVRGTLAEPKPEPRYIPKFLMSLLKPISILKNLLPKDDEPMVETPEKPSKAAPKP